MRVVFWCLVDDVLGQYIPINKSLQAISRKYPFFAMCSGEKAPEMIRQNYDATIIETINDVRLKGKTILKHMKNKDDYDALIKIDMDAIIMKEADFIEKIDKNLKKMSIIGNKRKASEGFFYIRGGCWAMHRTGVDAIKMRIPEHKKSGFDKPFNQAVIKAGIEQINCPLFEINRDYTGGCPVWHPEKIVEGIKGIPLRVKLFQHIISRYYPRYSR